MIPGSPNPNALVRCKCKFCGTSFFSERGTAEYCTASHKQKWYRWRTKLLKNKVKALSAVNEIASYLAYDQSVPAAALALQEIKSRVYEVLLDNKVQAVK